MESQALPPKPTELQIMLASGSPRRRELLAMIAPEFSVVHTRDIEEKHPDDMAADEVPAYLSRLKADAYDDLVKPGEVVITADTVVIHDNKILGKPADEAEARAMLRDLSGCQHHVVTGVTLRTATQTVTFSETTVVHFAELTDTEIAEYIMRFWPLDKAGAYGIQEWIGAIGITSITGDFYNVMGLPLHRLYKALTEL